MKNTNTNSSFWLGSSDDNYDVLTGEKLVVGKDLHKLSSVRRAISNFVNITTGENIPVKFSSGNDSYTDGKTVVISSNIKDKDFDSTVGLALHEGSHIKLTDFSVLPELGNIITTGGRVDLPKIMAKYDMDQYSARSYAQQIISQLLNIVEDRRIDYHIFTNAPGYKGYYHSMYDKYFNASIIDKALKQGAKNDPTKWDDYLFHICNFANANRNLSTLPALKAVWKTLNLSDIKRLPDTTAALNVALTIFNIVEDSIPTPEKSTDGKCEGKGQREKCEGEGESKTNVDGEEKGSETQPSKGGGGTDDGSKTTGTDSQDNTENLDIPKGGQQTCGNNTSSTPVDPLTDQQKRSLEKQIKKQKDFTEGTTKKSKLSKGDNKKVEAMDDSGSEMVKTGEGEYQSDWSHGQMENKKGFNTLVIRNLTKNLIDSDLYGDLFSTWRQENYQDNVDRGISLGIMLGKKLQVRNESSSLKNSRLNKGRIDKRLLASLGFGNENVFEQTFITNYNDAHVHLSIDASGSMSGNRFAKATISAVAIAKAASMIQGLDVVISYRTTTHVGTNHTPCILIGYDSRKDKFTKIKSLFKYIDCNGTTPEGLCFEAIQKEMVSGNNKMDSYFINFSDGEPWFSGQGGDYHGTYAHNHTKAMVNKMRDNGIKILSYMIDGSERSLENFTKMYGKDAQNVNVSKLTPLAKSLNSMFLKK